MAYACPVCSTTQADGEHLANHLAFTALLHGDDHEDWLEEHVANWGDRTPADLASAVVEFVPETDHDLEGEDRGSADAPPRLEDELGRASGEGRVAADPRTREIVEEAIELTEEMYADDGNHDEEADDSEVDGTEGSKDE